MCYFLDLGFDPSVDLYTEPYCDLIDDITEYKCLENSILGQYYYIIFFCIKLLNINV